MALTQTEIDIAQKMGIDPARYEAQKRPAPAPVTRTGQAAIMRRMAAPMGQDSPLAAHLLGRAEGLEGLDRAQREYQRAIRLADLRRDRALAWLAGDEKLADLDRQIAELEAGE